MRPWNKESKERRLRAELPRQSQTRNPALTRASRDLDPLSRSTWGAEAPSAAPGHGTGFGSPLGERSQSPVVEETKQPSRHGVSDSAKAHDKVFSNISAGDIGVKSNTLDQQRFSAIHSSEKAVSRFPQENKLQPVTHPSQQVLELKKSIRDDFFTTPGKRPTTPNVLYKDQFLMNIRNARDVHDHMATVTHTMPQPDFERGQLRDWQKMQIRMPTCRSVQEAAIISETAALIVAKEAQFRVTDKQQTVLDVSLAERPSSRLQAELLMAWLQTQLRGLTGRGLEQRPLLMGEYGTIAKDQNMEEQLHTVVTANLRSREGAEINAEMWEKLTKLWSSSSEPFMFLGVSEVDIEGIKLPNDKRYIRTLNQVAMHCHERGIVLAKIWNMQLGLLELEREQLRLGNESHINENRWLKDELQKASARAALVDGLQKEVTRLQQFEEDASIQIRALRAEIKEANSQIEDLQLKENIRRSDENGVTDNNVQYSDLQFEIVELRNQLTMAERQRDVSLTAMYSAIGNANESKLKVMELIQAEEARREALVDHVKDDEGTNFNLCKLNELSRLLNRARRIEAMAETELSFDMNMPIPYNNQLADVTLMVIHAKDAARKIGSSLSRDGDVDGEGGEEGGQNAGARSFKAALSRKMTIDKVKQIISESGIGKEAESSAFPGGPSEEPFEPSLMSADMSDVDEMTRSEMWQEIATLREREATLIRVLESYQIKELEQVPDDSKSSKSLAMAGLLIKALVRSKEEEAMAKNRLEAKKERMRNKALAKARNRGSSLLEAIGSAQDKAAAQEKDKMLLEVALMRMQYRDLWMLCTQVSNDPSIPAGKGIPPPPQFGQYFKKYLDQEEELSQQGRPENGDSSADDSQRAGKKKRLSAIAAKSTRNLNKLSLFSRAIRGDRRRSSAGADDCLSLEPRSKSTTSGGASRLRQVNNRNGVIAERSSEKLPAWKPGGVGGPGAGPSGYVHQPIKVKPKDKDVFKMLGAIAHTRFKAKDALLREALYKFQDTPARSPEWALKVIDSVYKAVASQESRGKKDHEESLPSILMQHFSSQYGAKALVQEYASAMVATLRKFEKTHVRLDIFSRFLSEEWEYATVLMYLEGTSLCGNIAMSAPFVDYPSDQSQRNQNPFICTRKALAIAAQLLGDRPLECTAGFSVLLQHHAEDAEPLEVQEHFWCPEGNQEDSEEEASRNGPFRKVRVLTFLKLLCNEAQRLNISISNASPRLFREWDDDADGQIVRENINGMMASLIGGGGAEWAEQADDFWHLCVRIETTESGDATSSTVGLEAFREACLRNEAIRRHLRMRFSPPPPPEIDEQTQELQSKMLFLLADRNWREFSKVVEVIITDMGDYMGPDESILRSMTAKIDSEAAGQAKAKLLVSIIKLLVDVKVTRLLAECNPSPDENTNLEAELESLQRAVKVMYGWDALVEDDYKVFRRMLDANATLVQRKKAGVHWSTCAKIFATYKIRMEAHASNLLKVEFASLWLKKHEKLKHSEGTHTLTQRHTEHLDVEDAALVMKPDDDEVLEQEEKRLLRLMSTVT